MRQVIGIVLKGRFGDHIGEMDACIISDPLEPAVCEMCPQGTPPYAVHTLDPDGIAVCMTHTFTRVPHGRVESVEPRKIYKPDGTVIDPWEVVPCSAT